MPTKEAVDAVLGIISRMRYNFTASSSCCQRLAQNIVVIGNGMVETNTSATDKHPTKAFVGVLKSGIFRIAEMTIMFPRIEVVIKIAMIQSSNTVLLT